MGDDCCNFVYDAGGGTGSVIDVGMVIGGPITGSAPGSVLFVGTGGVLAQDNPNLFWNDGADRLGIGTAVPGATLDIASATSTAGIAMRAGSTTPVSAAGTGRLRYNETTSTFQVSLNGAAYTDLTTAAPFTLDIGDAIGGSTAGSLLFVGAGNILQQDNINLFWNDALNRLGVGTSTPATTLHVFGAGMVNALGATQPTLESGSTAQFTVAYGGGNFGIASVRAAVDSGAAHLTLFKTRSTNPATKVALINGDTIGDILFFGVDSTAVVQRAAAITGVVNGAVGVGAVPTDLRFDTSAAGPPTERFRITSTGEVRIASMTLGSVLFAGASGAINQDNANLFWDNTNNRLGVGTTAPDDPVHVKTSNPGLNCFRAENTSTAGYSSYLLINSAGTFQGGIYWGNSAVAAVHSRDSMFWYSNGADINLTSATRHELTFGMVSGSTFMQMQNGASAAISSASTGRFRYTTTGQKFQVSTNGAAYFDLATLVAPLATSSILFANAAGQIDQDANFLWDTVANRLNVVGEINMAVSLKHIGVKVVGAQGAAVADAVGGTVIDAEARIALNALLARLRATTGHGLIA